MSDAIDYGPFELPKRPSRMQLLTWQIVNGHRSVEEARRIALGQEVSGSVLPKPPRVPKVLKKAASR